MRGKSKQIHLLKEDPVDACRSATLSSCRPLWQVLGQPLLWHWAAYDCLMTLFFTIVFALLFNNFL